METDTAVGQDHQRIDVNKLYDVREWAARFGVTPERLRQAVREVGVWSDEVKRHLHANG